MGGVRRIAALAAGALALGCALACGLAFASSIAGHPPSSRALPTVTAALPPPPGTPTSDVPVHTVSAPGLPRAGATFRRAQALLGRNRYVVRATNRQRLTVERADRWILRDGSLRGVSMIVQVAKPVDGVRWIPFINYAGSDTDVYTQKWVHLVLERVTRFRADVDFRTGRVVGFLPVNPDEQPPYHLVDPAHLATNIVTAPPR